MLLESSEIQRFADWSGDRNPLHVDAGFAGRTFFGRPLAHGVLAALAALRESGLGDLASLRTLDVEFRGAIYPGRTYAVESEAREDALSVTVSENGGPLLRITGRRDPAAGSTRPRTPPSSISNGDTSSVDQRREPEVHTVDALAKGLKHHGRFSVPAGPPPTPLGDLEPGLEVVLSLCSYVVGMEIPGLHSLFTRLRLTLHDVAAAPGTELRYSLATTRFDSRFRLLDTDLTVTTADGRPVAGAELRSYVPFSPGDTDIDALSRLATIEGPRPTGQVALVCGGSRGLGADIAAGLALAGYHVYATYRSSKAELTALAERLTRQGAVLTPVEGDVGDPAWCAATRQAIIEQHGRLDVLVLNACAPPRPGRFDADTTSRFESYVRDNLALVQRPLSTFLPDVDAARGCVVTISSSFVETPPPELSAYVTVKRAAEGLMHAVSTEHPTVAFLVARPPKLRTAWNDTPTAVLGTISTPSVAVPLVQRVVNRATVGGVDIVSDFHELSSIREDIPTDDGSDAVAPDDLRVAVVATFTTEPIVSGLDFWLEELGLAARPELAGYGQVVQALLDPTSVLSTNRRGLNVVLLRPSDWLRDQDDQRGAAADETRRLDAAGEVARAIRTHRAHAAVETLVLLCPSAPEATSDETDARVVAFLLDELREIAGVRTIVAREHHAGYAVGADDVHDELRDRIGHIPYTDRYYTFLATLVVRHLHTRLSAPRKVLAVDCDHTLWRGVVGEVGADGVAIDEHHTALQETLRRLARSGVLVCLCSKNDEADVWPVFDRRTDVRLSRDDVVAATINWDPKPDNLRRLADRLNVGLDSFMFLDDNPVECAAVRAGCPEVLTIQWPQDADAAQRLLRHWWELDTGTGTREDAQRTRLYRDEFRRREMQDETLSLAEFIASLDLEVDIAPIADDDVKRASQLTLRTNQFNFTTIRRDESEVQALARSDRHVCRVIRVKDRFGDYGLVGVLLAECGPAGLVVDTFLLSCRVLGRGVEHRMAAALGAVALEHDLGDVRFRVDVTPKNLPARTFLESLATTTTSRLDRSDAALVVTIPATECTAIRFDPESIPTGESPSTDGTTRPATPPTAFADVRHRERQIVRAAELGTLADLVAAGPSVSRPGAPVASPGASARTADDEVVAVFADALSLTPETVREVNQLEGLGCNSFKIVEITVALTERFPSLPSTLLFEHRSVSDIVTAIDGLRDPKEDSRPGPVAERVAAPLTPSAREADIAIVGMSVRCAGVDSPDELWTLLRNGRTSVGPVPADRAPRHGRGHHAGILDAIDQFDARFFGISPREAEYFDPQLRLLLEGTWRALEDAGDAGARHEVNTGVFVGAMYSDYLVRANAQAGRRDSPYRSWEGFSLANRVSQVLNLRGPSLVVNTACSSSGTALHLAANALTGGECSAAIVAGVNLVLDPERFTQLDRLGILSPSGRCRAFDAEADGTVLGEGVGVVVLRRLTEALRRGDRVYGVLKGTGVSSGTGTVGFTAPNPTAQADAIRQAVRRAGVDPRSVTYVEAHGTGTALGDPIEIRGLALAYGDSALQDPRLQGDAVCRIGSIKPNVGHLEAGAGMLGLIKVVLQMTHGERVPTLVSDRLNPAIPFDDLPFDVQRAVEPWDRPRFQLDGQPTALPRRAGLSSFGVGGANAHAIVEEAPEAPPRSADGAARPYLLTVSAQTAQSLDAARTTLARHLDAHPELDLHDAGYTLAVGRRHMDERVAFVGRDRERLVSMIDPQSPDGGGGIRPGSDRAGRPTKLAFLFTGQGAQYPGMGRQLYDTEPVFTETVDACAAILDGRQEGPLLDVLFASPDGPDAGRIHDTANTQPCLFVLEYALAMLWRSWGVSPDIVVGHSIGEIAALCVAGGISLEDALHLVAARGRLMQALPAGGAMTSLRADESTVRLALAGVADRVSIAALNGPEHVVISGDGPAVAAVTATLAADGVRATPLTVSHAFHSPLMEPMMAGLRAVATDVAFATPTCIVVSAVDGSVDSPDLLTPEHWVRQVREPVRFSNALATLGAEHVTTCLEIGPQPTLAALGRRGVRDPIDWLPSLRKGADDAVTMLTSLATLHVNGHDIDWGGFHAGTGSRLTGLPTYRFDRTRFWITDEPAPSSHLPSAPSATGGGIYDVTWRPAPPTSPTGPATDDHWLVLLETSGETGESLVRELRSRGARCSVARSDATYERTNETSFRIRRSSRADLRHMLSDCLDTGGTPLRIVCLWALDDTPKGDVPTDVLSLLRSIVTLVQTTSGVVEDAAAAVTVRLVTRGAVPASEALVEVSLTQAPLWGLGRTISLEHGELWDGLIDLDPDDDHADVARLTDALIASASDELAFRDGGTLVPRLTRHPRADAPRPAFRGDGRYLVTGGLGAIGLRLAAWIVERGGRQLTLVGRRGRHPSAQDAIDALERQGATVTVEQVDVTIEADLQAALDRARQAGPLRGIVHAAGVDHRVALARLTQDELASAIAGKVRGGWLLHRHTRDLDLDLFVCCSSIASVWGAPERAHYAAANAFLDGLAHERRRLGLTALSVNWGPWTGGGMATESDLAELGRIGNRGLQPDGAVTLLDQLVSERTAQATIADIDWERFRPVMEARGARPFFSEVGPAHAPRRGTPETPDRDTWTSRLTALPAERRSDALRTLLQAEVAHVLGLSGPDEVRVDRSLFDMGLDSLIAVDLAGALSDRLNVAVSVLDFNQPNVSALAESLVARTTEPDAAPGAEPDARLSRTAGKPEPRQNDADGIAGYTPTIRPEIVRFQERAYPHRRKEWIADRWSWMFERSAHRMGVEPRVWVYRDEQDIIGHHGAVPVLLKMNGDERVAPWFVESMVLEPYRGRAVGTQLLARSRVDHPFSLSLGQAPYMRDIQLKMGWHLVGPLGTYVYPLNGRALLQGKLKMPLLSHVAGHGLELATRLKRLRRRPAAGWTPDVREVDRFDARHDALWRQVSSELSCAVVRDASYLNWKYVDQPGQRFDRLEIHRGHDLVAVAVLSYADASAVYRYRRAFLVDLVLAPSAGDVVWQTLDAVRARATARDADALIMHLTAPALASQLERFGFLRREATRVMLVDTNGLPDDQVQTLCTLDNWYLTMGDSDIDRPWATDPEPGAAADGRRGDPGAGAV